MFRAVGPNGSISGRPLPQSFAESAPTREDPRNLIGRANLEELLIFVEPVANEGEHLIL